VEDLQALLTEHGVNELDKAIEEIARLLGVKVVYKYI